MGGGDQAGCTPAKGGAPCSGTKIRVPPEAAQKHRNADAREQRTDHFLEIRNYITDKKRNDKSERKSDNKRDSACKSIVLFSDALARKRRYDICQKDCNARNCV